MIEHLSGPRQIARPFPFPFSFFFKLFFFPFSFSLLFFPFSLLFPPFPSFSLLFPPFPSFSFPFPLFLTLFSLFFHPFLSLFLSLFSPFLTPFLSPFSPHPFSLTPFLSPLFSTPFLHPFSHPFSHPFLTLSHTFSPPFSPPLSLLFSPFFSPFFLFPFPLRDRQLQTLLFRSHRPQDLLCNAWQFLVPPFHQGCGIVRENPQLHGWIHLHFAQGILQCNAKKQSAPLRPSKDSLDSLERICHTPFNLCPHSQCFHAGCKSYSFSLASFLKLLCSRQLQLSFPCLPSVNDNFEAILLHSLSHRPYDFFLNACQLFILSFHEGFARSGAQDAQGILKHKAMEQAAPLRPREDGRDGLEQLRNGPSKLYPPLVLEITA